MVRPSQFLFTASGTITEHAVSAARRIVPCAKGKRAELIDEAALLIVSPLTAPLTLGGAIVDMVEKEIGRKLAATAADHIDSQFPNPNG